MEYDIKKVIDFLENDGTRITWDEFSDMLYDKFGEDSEVLIGCLAAKFNRNILSKEATHKITKAVLMLNEVF